MNQQDSDIIYEAQTGPKVKTQSLIGRCIRSWYLFVLFGAGFIMLAWLNLQRQTIQYSVTGKILIQDDDNEINDGSLFSGVARLRQGRLFTLAALLNEVEMLKSRGLMESVVSDLGLNIRYFKEGQFKDIELFDPLEISLQSNDTISNLFGLSMAVSDLGGNEYQAAVSELNINTGEYELRETLNGTFGRVESYQDSRFTINKYEDFEGEIRVQISSFRGSANQILGRLEIENVTQSEVLTISLRDNIPGRSIIIINKLIDSYNKEVLENKNKSVNKTIEFIDNRLEIIAKELFDIENELELFKRNNEVTTQLSFSAERFLGEVSLNDKAIGDLELQESSLAAIESELKNNDNEFELLSVDVSMSGQTPQAVIDYNELVLTREKLLVSATTRNPAIISMESQLAQLRTNLLDWIDFKKKELSNQKSYLIKKSTPLNDKIDKIPTYEREMLQIMRQQIIKEELYTFLLQRREESALAVASEVSKGRIINSPVLMGRVSPNKRNTYILGVAFGLGIPFLFVFFREMLDVQIYSRKGIRELTETPILGEIAFAGKKEEIKVLKSSKSVIAEMFRLLRSNLQFLYKAGKSNTILVTSSSSGEGKTFISINLAASFALSGKSVVIIGLDLRKPKLTTYLKGAKESTGVVNYLIGQVADLDELIKPVEDIDNLFYIGSGPIPPNPNELLLSERTKKMFAELKSRFEYVIIDSPPIGLVADAFSLKEQVDTSIYVTKFGHTSRAQVGIIEDIYQNQKLPNPAIVLNGVKKRVGEYGSAYGYGYGYGYGYYDGDDRTRLQKLFQLFKKS